MDSRVDDRARSPWTRPGVLIAAAFLLAVIVLGAVVVSRQGGGPAAADPSPSTSASTPTAPAGTATPSSSAPESVPADQTVPRVGPPATWVTVKTLLLPVSATAGPRVNTANEMTGYERTPTGALLAVADNDVRFPLVDDWRAATLSAVADTPGRAAFIEQRAAYGRVDPTPGQLTQIAGFNVVSYTPGRATIQLARVASDGGLTATTDTVVWERGDWKVLLPESGTTPPPAVLTSLQGYVPWSAS